MRRLHREEAVPTEIELRVARAVVATAGTDRHDLAQAMAEALERGTTTTADGIRKEREALLGELQDGPRAKETSREWALLRRIYGSFISADVRAMCEGRGPFLDRLPDDAARKRVQEAVLKLHREATYPEPSPWRGLHNAVARALGAEREQGREQGRDRGIGAEIEI